MSDTTPSEPPPSYAQATGSHATSSSNTSNQAGPSSGHLAVPGSVPAAQNGIPASHRRSMEDQARPLPKGWVRTFDPATSHQFFVDTTKDPPRSVWVHPYDDPTYLSTLSGEERERIEEESMLNKQPSKHDIMAEHTDEEDDDHHPASRIGSNDPELPPRPNGKGKANEQRTFGRKMKDKFTGTTHEERELDRKKRAEEEERLHQQHLRFREAMTKASQTGQPQWLGKDKDGKDVYVEPPQWSQNQGGYGYGNGYGGGGYGGGYSYNPYGNGVYTTPNARYIRPSDPYNRPYGSGYGGGYGLPLAIGGGMLGGLLLGDLLFF